MFRYKIRLLKKYLNNTLDIFMPSSNGNEERILGEVQGGQQTKSKLWYLPALKVCTYLECLLPFYLLVSFMTNIPTLLALPFYWCRCNNIGDSFIFSGPSVREIPVCTTWSWRVKMQIKGFLVALLHLGYIISIDFYVL